jgi:hypothetical protein
MREAPLRLHREQAVSEKRETRIVEIIQYPVGPTTYEVIRKGLSADDARALCQDFTETARGYPVVYLPVKKEWRAP